MRFLLIAVMGWDGIGDRALRRPDEITKSIILILSFLKSAVGPLQLRICATAKLWIGGLGFCCIDSLFKPVSPWFFLDMIQGS